MANIIDTTYFHTDLNTASEINSFLTEYITKYEPIILKKTLSYDLYKAFLAGLAEDPIPAKWTNLRDGCEYANDGIYYKWIGLVNSTKQSLIANYVLYQFILTGFNNFQASGIWLANTENSKLIDLGAYQCKIYNEMVDWISEMNDFILYSNDLDSETYPNYYPETIEKINIFGI